MVNALNYQPISHELWIQHLRTGKRETVALAANVDDDARLEDYIVIELAGFNNVRYEEQADQLYELASQAIEHFLNYLSLKKLAKF